MPRDREHHFDDEDPIDIVINKNHPLYSLYQLENSSLTPEQITEIAMENFNMFKNNLENDIAAEAARVTASLMMLRNRSDLANEWYERANEAVTVKNCGRNHGNDKKFLLRLH